MRQLSGTRREVWVWLKSPIITNLFPALFLVQGNILMLNNYPMEFRRKNSAILSMLSYIVSVHDTHTLRRIKPSSVMCYNPDVPHWHLNPTRKSTLGKIVRCWGMPLNLYTRIPGCMVKWDQEESLGITQGSTKDTLYREECKFWGRETFISWTRASKWIMSFIWDSGQKWGPVMGRVGIQCLNSSSCWCPIQGLGLHVLLAPLAFFRCGSDYQSWESDNENTLCNLILEKNVHSRSHEVI